MLVVWEPQGDNHCPRASSDFSLMLRKVGESRTPAILEGQLSRGTGDLVSHSAGPTIWADCLLSWLRSGPSTDFGLFQVTWLNSRKWWKKTGKGVRAGLLKMGFFMRKICQSECFPEAVAIGQLWEGPFLGKEEKAFLRTLLDPPSSNSSHCNEDWWVIGSSFCPRACVFL